MEHPIIIMEEAAWLELNQLVKTLTESIERLQNDQTKPDVLTHKEAAQYIGYSAQRLHKLKGETTPYSQHSRKITYRRSDLDAFLMEHRIDKRKRKPK